MMNALRKIWFAPLALLTAVIMMSPPAAAQQQQKPNILVIMGDDIGMWNVSAYSHGMMGFKTPNIDRIAKEGRDVQRHLRPTVLHRRACGVHHRPVALPHWSAQSRPAGRQGRIV
jgi:hypothetical protein